MRHRGVTLTEILITLTIIAIGAGLVIPQMRSGVENREAKQALNTLHSILQAVRLYEVDKGNLQNAGGNPINLANLESEGYVLAREYAPKFNYSINLAVQPIQVTATNPTTGRVVTLAQDPNSKSRDGAITDSGHFLAG